MIKMIPITLPSGATVIGTEVKLPKTSLLSISSDKGYIMCGALDVALLNDKLKDRQIIAARAVGVRTLDELLHAPLESVTHEAERLGVTVGMRGIDALELML
ncbi:YunC family protein [Paenibacillus septentrionalis]|uniref:YunC family protein n=1 Tax=Paenibacillus septentrionalis TaxID=429342 RepID=A0ABW1V4H4_9BACL